MLTRLVTALASAALMAGALVAGPAAPASAASPAVTATIASVTPTVATKDGDVTITGQVTNVSGQPVTYARAALWTSGQALTTPDALTQALSDPPAGGRVTYDSRASTPLGSPATATSMTGTLSAGATVGFTVTSTMSALGMATPNAAYLLGVQVLGRANGGVTTVLARLYIVVSYADPSKPARWAQVVELTAAPSLVRAATDTEPAVFADDHLATELTGRLSDELTAALRPGVTVLIDPALWDALTAMAKGYDVQTTADADPTTGKGQTAAQNWLAQAEPLLSRTGTYRTLVGDPDIALAAASGRADVLTRTAQPLPADDPLAALPLAVLPRDGQCDATLLTYLAPASANLIICRSQPDAPTITRGGGHSVLGVTQLPDATTLTGWAGAQQALFDAEMLLRSNVDQPIAVLGSSQVPSAALPSTLTADLPDGTSATQLAASSDPSRKASASLIDATTAAERDLGLAGTLGGTDAAAAAEITRVVGGLWNVSWRTDDTGQAAALAWADRIVAPVTAQVTGGGLQLKIANEVHLSASDSPMPVTVVNTYNMTVQVRVHFHSDNPQRLGIPDSDLVSVDPGESALVRVTPQAGANGAVSVQATLESSSGQTLGAPVEFVVTTTSAGRLGWIIVIGAGIAFLVATMLRVRQVRRNRAAARAAS